MKITQLRNATVVIELEAEGQVVVLLVDPMLAVKGALPSLKWLGGNRRRNPLVELPDNALPMLSRVTHALITHCQRGHFDHLDRAGVEFLRERNVPVFCMARDARHLEKLGLRVLRLETTAFFGGTILPVRCVHGEGVVGGLMEHGFGYFIELPGEPSLYLSGDTILTDDIRQHLATHRPDVSVLPAGGARFDLGGEIIMNGEDVCEACTLTPGVVIANHLEALDHCPTTRDGLKALAQTAGVLNRLQVLGDGQCFELSMHRRSGGP